VFAILTVVEADKTVHSSDLVECRDRMCNEKRQFVDIDAKRVLSEDSKLSFNSELSTDREQTRVYSFDISQSNFLPWTYVSSLASMFQQDCKNKVS